MLLCLEIKFYKQRISLIGFIHSQLFVSMQCKNATRWNHKVDWLRLNKELVVDGLTLIYVCISTCRCVCIYKIPYVFSSLQWALLYDQEFKVPLCNNPVEVSVINSLAVFFSLSPPLILSYTLLSINSIRLNHLAIHCEVECKIYSQKVFFSLCCRCRYCCVCMSVLFPKE